MPDLTCPVCGGVLHREERSLRCGAGHCYDIARQGYVNLLRSNQSKSKRHGDDKRMVAARTAFLDAGYYAPLRDAVAAAAAEFTADDADVLDAGCGEGYYTAQVLRTLRQQGRAPSVCGVDISRDALICAHRRAPELTLAVASIAHLPVADASCDLLLNVFAPHDADEFARVLRPQGVLLRVIPLERHLWGLKCAVYDRPYENEVPDPALPGFALAGRRELRGTVTLRSQAEIEALFCMTPYYYKTGARDQAKLRALDTLTTETEFALLIYHKA